jgi:hypothetical protein
VSGGQDSHQSKVTETGGAGNCEPASILPNDLNGIVTANVVVVGEPRGALAW